MAKIETARVQVETSQNKLDAARLNGDGTAEARQALEAAQQKLDRRLSDRARATEPDLALEESIEAESQPLLDDAHAKIRDALSAALNLDRPKVSLNANVVDAVIRARHTADRDRTHADKLAELQGRLRALDARREAIVTERTSGHRDDATQGPELALIAAESDGLRALIARHQADAISVASKGDAETQWQAHCSTAQGAALLQVANELQARLIDVAEKLVTLSGGRMDQRFRPDPRWLPNASRGVW